MVIHAAVGARQRASVPRPATSATPEIPAPLDAAYFRKGWPRPADGTVPFLPALGDRRRPAAATCVQEWHGKKGDNGLKRLRVRAGCSCDFLDPVAVLTQ